MSKVYTVADDTRIIDNKDITVDYDGESYFSVKVVTADGRSVGAGEIVKFTINGKTTTVKTDNDGIARIKITELPGKYTLTTSYNDKIYQNTVTVKPVPTANKATIKKISLTASKVTIKKENRQKAGPKSQTQNQRKSSQGQKDNFQVQRQNI